MPVLQGWGNTINTMVLVILMAAFGQYHKPYNTKSLEIVWRLSYALGCIPLVFMVIWRVFILKESNVWLKKRQSVKDLGEWLLHASACAVRCQPRKRGAQ